MPGATRGKLEMAGGAPFLRGPIEVTIRGAGGANAREEGKTITHPP